MHVCMHVLSADISKDLGRGMRYRLHLVAFMTYNASPFLTYHRHHTNHLDLDLPFLGLHVDLKPSFAMIQFMYAYIPPLPGISGEYGAVASFPLCHLKRG
jgi:hypothetical protein